MTNKIAFIIDDSPQYLDEKTSEIMKSWGFTQSQYKTVTKWFAGIANQSQLFSEPKAIRLDLTDNTDFSNFIKFIKEDKKGQKVLSDSDWYGVGTVITAHKAKGSKEIEKLVTASNGLFIKKRKPEEVKEELLNSINIDYRLKAFLSDYAGTDYDLLLNCVKSIKRLTPEESSKLTIDKLIVFLPVKKGAVPPWEYVNSLLYFNTEKTLDKLRRILQNSHSLLAITFLKRKIEELYNEKVLYVGGIKTYKERSEILGINQWASKNNNNIVNNVSLDVLENLVYLVNSSEGALKGDKLIISPEIYLEQLVTKVLISLKYNQKVG